MDPQTHRNCTHLRNEGFKHQIEGIVDAYICWQETIGEDSPASFTSSRIVPGNLPPQSRGCLL